MIKTCSWAKAFFLIVYPDLAPTFLLFLVCHLSLRILRDKTMDAKLMFIPNDD